MRLPIATAALAVSCVALYRTRPARIRVAVDVKPSPLFRHMVGAQGPELFYPHELPIGSV